jgi:glutathione synthase/RimK-type ligase-like ATP-grasp enzyme
MIGIATSDYYPDLYPPDKWLLSSFSDVRLEAKPVIWDDTTVDWSIFDAIIIRSTWDYYTKVDAWRSWLNKLDDLGIPLINDASIVRSNMDKSYLNILKQKGIKIVDSLFIDKGTSLADCLNNVEYDELIIKPTISAGSHLTERFQKQQIKDIIDRYSIIGMESDLIVQPFLPEITDGEISLVYFENKFSHSIIKKPTEGDFRIQLQFGGQYSAYLCSDELIEFGHKALTTLSQNTVYGRVDCILLNDVPHVMEVELIEPDLYFDYHPMAKSNYFNALHKKLKELIQ